MQPDTTAASAWRCGIPGARDFRPASRAAALDLPTRRRTSISAGLLTRRIAERIGLGVADVRGRPDLAESVVPRRRGIVERDVERERVAVLRAGRVEQESGLCLLAPGEKCRQLLAIHDVVDRELLRRGFARLDEYVLEHPRDAAAASSGRRATFPSPRRRSRAPRPRRSEGRSGRRSWGPAGSSRGSPGRSGRRRRARARGGCRPACAPSRRRAGRGTRRRAARRRGGWRRRREKDRRRPPHPDPLPPPGEREP